MGFSGALFKNFHSSFCHFGGEIAQSPSVFYLLGQMSHMPPPPLPSGSSPAPWTQSYLLFSSKWIQHLTPAQTHRHPCSICRSIHLNPVPHLYQGWKDNFVNRHIIWWSNQNDKSIRHTSLALKILLPHVWQNSYILVHSNWYSKKLWFCKKIYWYIKSLCNFMIIVTLFTN